jgi:2'-5' RNA ligase
VDRLASAINEGLQLAGFQAETRPFIPHLTLARLKQRAGSQLQTWLQQHQHESWGLMQVREIYLYQSELSPIGARYSILHSATFSRRN